MNTWQWERFDEVVTADRFGVTNAGSLIAPVRGFSVARDDKMQLVLETLAPGHAPGTIVERCTSRASGKRTP